MHCLYGLSQFPLNLELKGGTSLSKGYGIIHRFSEDIDIKIEPDEKTIGFKVFCGKNHDKPKHRESKKNFFDNRAKSISCYKPQFTFTEKLQAIVTKYAFYKEGKNDGRLPINFLRHYYDIYCLLALPEVKNFIGTTECEDYKKERFRKYDTVIKNCEGFTLKDKTDRKVFEDNYTKSSALYYKGQVPFQDILDRIAKVLESL